MVPPVAPASPIVIGLFAPSDESRGWTWEWRAIPETHCRAAVATIVRRVLVRASILPAPTPGDWDLLVAALIEAWDRHRAASPRGETLPRLVVERG
jgi:hypothetical protein